MPNRILREGILDSEPVDSLGANAEVLYRRLMSVHDDWGRFTADPCLVRSRCYPRRVDKVREADLVRWMTEVHSAGLIVLYAVAGKAYMVFLKHDKPRASSSKYPAPVPQNIARSWQHLQELLSEQRKAIASAPCAHVRADDCTCAQLRPYSNAYSDSDSNAHSKVLSLSQAPCAPGPPGRERESALKRKMREARVKAGLPAEKPTGSEVKK